jgi:hypothetical protein
MVFSGWLIFKVALPVLVPSAAYSQRIRCEEQRGAPPLRIAHSIPVIDSDLLGLYAAAVLATPGVVLVTRGFADANGINV